MNVLKVAAKSNPTAVAGAHLTKKSLEAFVLVAQQVAEDVHLVLAHIGIDLHPLDHLDAEASSRGQRLGNAFGGVVIGESQGSDAMFAGRLD